MKEAPSKKMPRKASGGGVGPAAGCSIGTPTKLTSEEIFATLLRVNNFDSSIKDESLDIDLSACVTISGNSLSYTDFWRVLDESAQNNSQLDINDEATTTSRESLCPVGEENEEAPPPLLCSSLGVGSNQNIIKQEQRNTFSGTFLRPEPPTNAFSTPVSPLKKYIVKTSPTGEQQSQPPTYKTKIWKGTSVSHIENKESKIYAIIKEEPAEQLQLLADDDAAVDAVTDSADSRKPTSSHSFNLLSFPSHMECKEEVASPSYVLPESLYKCLDCDGLLLRGQKEFSTHNLASHRIHFKCVECERDFEQEAGLKKHQKSHRSVEARKDAWKKCPDCGKCLKLGSMWMHRKIHSDNKKYGCDICGQKFVQKINLTHHSRVHTAEKPYECPECQKRFQERSHLQRHQKYHAQTRSYRCDKCGKMYKTERCLKVHNLVHLEQRPFACNVCAKSFISNSKLKQHSNIHTGERPFKCNYCPRDFTNFPNWLKHTRRRHKVDHKTGEHLENIPSYCSKKSSKTAKTSTSTTSEQSKCSVSTTTDTITVTTSEPATIITKPQTKRRKKISQPVSVKEQSSVTKGDHLSLEQTINVEALQHHPSNVSTIAEDIKATKVKRERKQLSPKQVQKSLQPSIKKELIELQTSTDAKPPTVSNFPDLSITSAEEFIMEQALEMEECGLYVSSTPSVLDTDNAISSDTAAAMHFKIKSEFNVDRIKKEEFVSLKDLNNRLLCSSLESSPFSSPASIEFTLSAVPPTLSATATDYRSSSNATFYMPSFTLNSQGTLVTNMSTAETSAASMPPIQIIPQSECPLPSDMACAPSTSNQLPTAQTLINHLYLHPMGSGMPLLMQPNQVLPSVDTLLFSSRDSAT